MKQLKLVSTGSKSKSPSKTPASTDEAAAAMETEPVAPQPTTPATPYQPKLEEISLYMSEEDVKAIETIINSYWKAYR